MLRFVFLFLLILGQIGIGTIDLLNKNWKTGVVALLIAICNVIIFWPTRDM